MPSWPKEARQERKELKIVKRNNLVVKSHGNEELSSYRDMGMPCNLGEETKHPPAEILTV